MNEAQRQKQLKQLIEDDSNIYSTGVPLIYRGETIRTTVYRIPLDYLIYNKLNGRISSRVKAYERENHTLNAEDPADASIIEDLLWGSNEARNDRTMKDLVTNGQIRHGIVTANGVIIDGNRRASLLARAYRERSKHKEWSPNDVEKCRFFNAIILPQNAEDRDIQQLETTYQMGEDDKLDYNPIEKYLKCRDLIEVGFDVDQIATMMGEKTSTPINTWLETLKVMDTYLFALGYEDMYPMLDHYEDQFLSLQKGLQDLRKHSAIANTDWEYTDTDIDDLQDIAFDYIRYGQEGKEFRRICKPSKTDWALFQNETVWSSFKEQHDKTLKTVEEPELDVEIAAHPGMERVEVLRARDARWKASVEDDFKNNLKYSVRKLDDKIDDAKPKVVLRKVRDMLVEIDTEQDGFLNDPVVGDLVREISSMMWRFKKALGQ